MTRTLNEVLGAFTPERQARIAARHEQLRQEVENLNALRGVVGRTQAQIATALGITQPSVSKIERQTDMYLSTLRAYVEALGGKLDLVVHMPDQPPLHLGNIGDLSDFETQPATERHVSLAD